MGVRSTYFAFVTAEVILSSAEARDIVVTTYLVDSKADFNYVILKVVEQVVKGVILAVGKLIAGGRVRERRRRIAGRVGIAVRAGSVGVTA